MVGWGDGAGSHLWQIFFLNLFKKSYYNDWKTNDKREADKLARANSEYQHKKL